MRAADPPAREPRGTHVATQQILVPARRARAIVRIQRAALTDSDCEDALAPHIKRGLAAPRVLSLRPLAPDARHPHDGVGPSLFSRLQSRPQRARARAETTPSRALEAIRFAPCTPGRHLSGGVESGQAGAPKESRSPRAQQ